MMRGEVGTPTLRRTMFHGLQELAEALCALVAADTPQVDRDDDGIDSFTIEHDGVAVTITHDPLNQPDFVLAYVFFGAIAPESELLALRDLLNANLLSRSPYSPMFSRDPVNGGIVLKLVWPLADLHVPEMWSELQTLLERVRRWRIDFFLQPPHEPPREDFFSIHPTSRHSRLA